MSTEPQDWVEWHRAYDDPQSRLSRRLAVVQRELRRAIDAHEGPLRIISMCAGEGRDVIPVVASHPRRDEIAARLVELDPRNAALAREAAGAAGLTSVEVVEGDAALLDSYIGAAPADIVLACGIFGNITEDDIRRTIAYLPCLCAPAATVLWTRGHFLGDARDVALEIRQWFIDGGFREVSYDSPDGEGATYRVGSHQLAVEPRALEPGVRMFTFFR